MGEDSSIHKGYVRLAMVPMRSIAHLQMYAPTIDAYLAYGQPGTHRVSACGNA